MNALQIKQKMLELCVSDTYMAQCCGVGINYFRCVLNGSRTMTNKLQQKIECAFKNLLIKPKSADQHQKEEPTTKPKWVVTEDGKLKDVEEEKRKLKIEYYRGRVEGFFATLGVMESIVAEEDRTYSQGFVEMFCGIQQKLCKSVFELLDILDKKEG